MGMLLHTQQSANALSLHLDDASTELRHIGLPYAKLNGAVGKLLRHVNLRRQICRSATSKRVSL